MILCIYCEQLLTNYFKNLKSIDQVIKILIKKQLTNKIQNHLKFNFVNIIKSI